MGVWLKPLVGSTPLWISAAEEHAKGSFETACEEYVKALELIPSGSMDADLLNAPVVEFIVNRVSDELYGGHMTCSLWSLDMFTMIT